MQTIHVQKEPEGMEEMQPKQNSNKTTAIWKTSGRQWIRQNNAVPCPEKVKFDGNTQNTPMQHNILLQRRQINTTVPHKICPTSIKQTPYYSTKCLLKSGKYHSAAQNTWTLPITLLS